MSFIEIRQEMKTGNEEIDTHHQHLVELFNKSFSRFKLGKHKDELKPLLEELVNFATFAFNTEELWMFDCSYPEAHLHEGEHKAFIKSLNEIQRSFATGAPSISLQILGITSRQLRSHIYGSDMKMARFVRQQKTTEKAA